MSSNSSAEEDNIDNIALLPERKKRFKRVRINRSRLYEGQNFTLTKHRGMCTRRRALIFSSVSAIVLFSVVLVAVFARPSSSSEDQYDFTDKRSPLEDEILEIDEQDENIYTDEFGEPFSWQQIKLPSSIKPVHYHVHLRPNLTSFEFSGNVKVLVKCTQNTRTIHIHSRDLHIRGHHVYTVPTNNEDFEELPKASNSGRKSSKLQMFAIILQEELKAGEYYIVYIEFTSSLSNGLSGFYKSSYKTKSNETRYLATTHFEPTDARRAFPCFDEPALKANFTIIITHHENYSALSNMPISRTVKLNNSLVEDHFATSVKMSTYLVAFVVCDFKYKESFTKNDKIRVRVWAPADQIDQANFAVGAAVKVLSYYENFFKVPFPLPKMDLIAIPDFSAGAMENWGLITYRLTSLLYEPKESSSSNKQWVAVVVAHELAHQWFGNLVTMKWWNDLWLNEGFASFVEFIGANVVAPDWKMLDQFIVSDLETALELDQLSNSHPVSVPVHDPAQINEIFDSISYDKGASIIRMLKNFLGEEVFNHGLQQYLKKHAFGNAETDDLWQSFTDSSSLYAKKTGSNDEVNVKAVMDTWTLQMGFPLITLTRKGDLVVATQRHFLVNPKAKPAMKSPFNYKWKVPLTFRTDVDSKKKLKWMDSGEDSSLIFNVPENTGWIKANVDQYGYYRVNYDLENWKRLIYQMQNNHEALTAADRAGLLDDIFSLARSGDVAETLALDMTLYLTKETEYVPYVTATANLAYIASQLSYFSEPFEAYKGYLRQQVKPALLRLGWEDKGTHLEKYLRTQVLSQACHSDEEKAIAGVLKMFNDWKDHGKKVPPNLRSLVYSVGIKKGSQENWKFVFNKYMVEAVASEKKKLLYALTSSSDEETLKRYLRISLNPSKVRTQDTTYVINAIARNRVGHQLAWNFFRDNYDLLFKRYGKTSFDFGRMIKAVTAHFNTVEMKHEVEEFFKTRNAGSGTRAVQQSLESIVTNINWVKKHKEEVVRWLKAHTAGSKSQEQGRDE